MIILMLITKAASMANETHTQTRLYCNPDRSSVSCRNMLSAHLSTRTKYQHWPSYWSFHIVFLACLSTCLLDVSEVPALLSLFCISHEKFKEPLNASCKVLLLIEIVLFCSISISFKKHKSFYMILGL